MALGHNVSPDTLLSSEVITQHHSNQLKLKSMKINQKNSSRMLKNINRISSSHKYGQYYYEDTGIKQRNEGARKTAGF